MSTPERISSPSTAKRNKRVRKKSSGEFSIEELSPDDMGYDADIEVIRPDKYEEVESESEDVATPSGRRYTVDEELAARMKQLGREHFSQLRTTPDRGRKRRSVEMAEDDSLLGVPLSPNIDIQEIVDNSALPSPAKRRRRKSRRPNTTQHPLNNYNGSWLNSSERADSSDKAHEDESTSSTPSENTAHQREDDDVMMDIT